MLPITKRYFKVKNIKRAILGVLLLLGLVILAEPSILSKTSADLNDKNSDAGDEYLIYSESTTAIETETGKKKVDLAGSIVPTNDKNVHAKTQLEDMWSVSLKKYLQERNSPTADYAYLYVEYANKYNVPVVLMPAVAEAETFSCTHREDGISVAPSAIQRNCWGIGGGPSTRTKFPDWDTAIRRSIEIIADNYGQGSISLVNMQRNYCGSWCPDDVWARRVMHYVDEINDFVEANGGKRDTSVTL
ncbi:hypothetical protein KC660_03415 [Candidatus Dojkabacteria bacterium]|uniref:Mannosyl-glycoprotein endo-beta-N-acetylglucosamidase-like domain-containing protein n=1 Tax=Candidatus Dojkabacteria bacterium TaxID=2099670 RepID=A0A955L4E9_9BACT|nr:hypothetical protein [Candidatus Dojkabacteria bacterium]